MGWDYDLDRYKPHLRKRIAAGVCEVTGVALDMDGFNIAPKRWNTPSIDRIDATKGYTYDNIRIVCSAANCGLGKWGEAAFVRVLKAIAMRQ
jgi:hypothetical protein